MTRPDYALIVGQGRSGTNWLLELFDLSPETFCRSEPYSTSGSPLKRVLPNRWVVRPGQDALEAEWDAAVKWTCLHMGTRDKVVRVPKRYLHEPARRLGLYRIIRGPRLREALGLLAPSFRSGEWRIPWWLGSQRGLAECLPVLKLTQPPGWAAFVLNRRPQIPVFHIIRHPGGFLNSWLSRYLAVRDEGEVRRANQLRLREIAEVDAEWAAAFGDIERMSAEESELWYWRYANEVIHRAGRGSDRYHRIIYEELAADAAAITKPLYAACGLQWTPSIEAAMRARGARSSTIAEAWREKLTPDQLRLVERVAKAARSFYAASG